MSINRGMDKDVVHICRGILAIKRNRIGSFVETWMDLETVIQSEVSQKEEHKYCILINIWNLKKIGIDDLINKAEIETQM